MKTNPSQSKITAKGGFTLPELMIASALFVLLTAAVICTFLFGLHLRRTAEVKLTGSDAARKVLVSLTDEIRSATRVQIGTGSLTNFQEKATNAVQAAAAIQIYPSGDTNTWVRYYCDTDPKSTNSSRLCRTTSADGNQKFTIVVPHDLVNTGTMFSAEDRSGNPLSNHQNNRVIGVNLQLYQIEDTVVKVANAQKHDFYQLRTRITRRRLY